MIEVRWSKKRFGGLLSQSATTNQPGHQRKSRTDKLTYSFGYRLSLADVNLVTFDIVCIDELEERKNSVAAREKMAISKGAWGGGKPVEMTITPWMLTTSSRSTRHLYFVQIRPCKSKRQSLLRLPQRSIRGPSGHLYGCGFL